MTEENANEITSEEEVVVETVPTANDSEQVENKVLNPVTQKVVERSIGEVLGEYVQEQKLFTADSLHYLRTRVTSIVKERLGDEEVTSVDIGLDLSALEDIPFFFKINIPKEKVETHILSSVEDDEESPAAEDADNEE